MIDPRFQRAMVFGVLAIAFAAPVFAQEDEGPEITRADLATSYLRLETALKDAELDESETIRVNQAFDAATLKFFAGQMGAAIQQIDELTASLGGGAAVLTPASFRASISPPVYITGADENPTLSVIPLYAYEDDDIAEPVSFTVSNASGEEGVVLKFAAALTDLREGDVTFDLPVQGAALPAGRYTIHASLGEGEALELGRWSVVEESLDAVAAANTEVLKTIAASTPALEQALATCTARNGLLSDTPSPENTAQLLFDPNQLANDIAAEIEALKSGNDPYANREGDYWRVLKAGEKVSPMRVYLPASADVSKPLPLVVAFHGAGGDENMFMDAYGAGVIKETADKLGFLLVTPRTYDYNASIGEMFDALVEALKYDYDIDSDRIYIVGHSMGGGAVNNLINARPTQIAAAAALCGFRQLNTTKDETPPTLVVAAELDPLAKPERVEPGAQKAIDEGLPVEYKLVKNYGHTLVVGDIMHETVEWLLQHTRD